MIGSMSSAAWKAWRIFFDVIRPSLWFGTAVIQPYGLTTRASMPLKPLTRSYWSCLICWAKWYSPVSTPARRTATSGTGRKRISSTYAVRLPP